MRYLLKSDSNMKMFGIINRFSCDVVFGRSIKRFSLKSSAQFILKQMPKSDNCVKSDDIYDDKCIPPLLLRPGQAIWRFKNYFGQLKPERAPKCEAIHESLGVWTVKVFIFQPKPINFIGRAQQKRTAEAIAMAKSLMWLRDNGLSYLCFCSYV